MRLKQGLPYMIVGSAIVLAYLGLKDGKAKNMIDNMINKMKKKSIHELEDMM